MTAVLALVRGLLMRDELRSVCGSASVTFVADGAALEAHVGPGTVAIVDLELLPIDSLSVSVERLTAAGATTVFFAPHVRGELFTACAQGGGIAIPRSKLRGTLAGILSNPAMDSRGAGSLTMLFFGLLTALAVYSSYRIIPFYYYFYELQQQMEAVILVGDQLSDAGMRRRLVEAAETMEIAADPEDLRIERNGREIEIVWPYEEVFDLSWGETRYEIHVFQFEAYAFGEY